jgi:hypothetical protein
LNERLNLGVLSELEGAPQTRRLDARLLDKSDEKND